MKKLAVWSVVGLSALLVACGSGEEKKQTASSKDEGYQAYGRNSCVGCHGKDLEGASGPKLADIGKKYSEKEILDIIKNGKGTMPKNQASGEDAKLIAKYLASKK